MKVSMSKNAPLLLSPLFLVCFLLFKLFCAMEILPISEYVVFYFEILLVNHYDFFLNCNQTLSTDGILHMCGLFLSVN